MLKCSKKCLLLLQLTGAYHQQAPDLIKASPVAVETNWLSCETDSVDFKRSSSCQYRVKSYKDRAFIEDIANGERSPDLGNTVRVQSRPTNCVLQSVTGR